MASDVVVHKAGVAKVMKSSGVQSMLKTEVKKAAARCNAAYSLKTSPRVEPYSWQVDEHASTAVGHVWTHTLLGRADNAHSNTLKKGTGW